MKKLLVIVTLLSATTVYAGGTMRAVCHEVKGKNVCKNIKVHKKFDGTPIPEKAPVKPKPKKK
jgi:hypothetical protein